MNERERKDIQIFSEALEFTSASQRADYLRQACGSDEPLRQKVQALLQIQGEADGFFGTVTRDANRAVLSAVARSSVAEIDRVSGPVEAPGTMIGRYKLLQQIGEGGCGVVYMAEQEAPVKRRVALKIIKLGMDTKSVIARFEAERQALALMDHPNIAKVFDAGSTESGRPYFVMELVRGTKITEYCDEKQLCTRERLELFSQVCHAIQHAHQKGIIHRDIKPANVLVTINDGVAVPKVIDFGIAKATTDQRLTDKTVFTAFEQFIGTPAYMSPEQAEITSLDVDTRSDIYSLGVLLYELLTGKTPFDAAELLSIGLDAMRRTIREKEPARPSTRVSTLGAHELTTTAKRRGLEPPKLANLLRGDLDWIVMRCLEKDRARRYETANGLALDIRRHLNNETVLARPPSKLYRFQKMVSRNKGALAATAAVAVILILGLGVSSWMFWRERVARNRAMQAEEEQSRLRQRAEDKETKAAQLAEYLKNILQGAGDEAAQGHDPTMLLDMLDRGIQLASGTLTNQPWLQKDLYTVIAQVYANLGRYQQAEILLGRALLITRELIAKHSQFEDMSPNESAALLRLSDVLRNEGKLSEAEATDREALAVTKASPNARPGEISAALSSLANSLSRQFKWPEAEKLYRESQELVPAGDTEQMPIIKRNLAYVLGNEGRHTEGENLAREAVEIQMTRDPNDPELATSVNYLALAFERQGKLDDAEKAYTEFVPPSGSPLAQNPELLVQRAALFGRRAKWTAALEDLNHAVELHPIDSFIWHLRTAVLIAQHQTNECHDHCRKMLARFGHATSPLMTETVSRDCLILPASGLDLGLIAKLADNAIQVPTNYVWLSAALVAKALAEYRQAHFEAAAEWAQKVLARAPITPGDPERSLQAVSVLAMSKYRLDQKQEAKTTLADALRRKQELPRMESGDLGHPWLELVFGKTLLTEAEQLINGQTSGVVAESAASAQTGTDLRKDSVPAPNASHPKPE